MSVQTEAVEAIEAQQKAVKYHSRQWMAGEQLKEICRREPKSAELLLADLQREAMSITAAEKRIEAFARKNGNCASPIEAEEVLGIHLLNLPLAVADGGGQLAHVPTALRSVRAGVSRVMFPMA